VVCRITGAQVEVAHRSVPRTQNTLSLIALSALGWKPVGRGGDGVGVGGTAVGDAVGRVVGVIRGGATEGAHAESARAASATNPIAG
jgi:hypothetical protein